MNDKFEQQLGDRFFELDQPVHVDASKLTAKLVAIRASRKRKMARNRKLTVISGACVVMFGIAYQLLPFPDYDNSPAAANSVELDQEATFFANFDSPITSYDQEAKLQRLKAKVSELRRTSAAQKLTLIRENISRSVFNNPSHPEIFE